MTLQRKVFRIEQSEQEIVLEPGTERPAVAHDATLDMTPDPMPDLSAAQRHHELIAEIKALRALVEPKEEAQRILETYQVQLAEMQKLKGELVIIHNAITRTKQEIATLHVTGFHGESMSRMTHELDPVVSGPEQAPQTILNMVEDIYQPTPTLTHPPPTAAAHHTVPSTPHLL